MDHCGAARLHEEWRLFDYVMADVDDAVRILHRAMDKIACRQRRAAQKFGVPLVDNTLAHLRGQKRDTRLLDELFEHAPGHLAVCTGANHQDRRLGLLDKLDRLPHCLGFGRGASRDGSYDRLRIGLLFGNVLGKFEVHRAGFFLFGQAISLAHTAGNIVASGKLVRIFGNRAHHRDHVENLEATLLRLLDRLLPGDHHHRHSAKLCIGGGGHEIGRARSQRREAHAGLASMATIGGSHEACTLFVTRQDQLDLVRA